MYIFPKLDISPIPIFFSKVTVISSTCSKFQLGRTKLSGRPANSRNVTFRHFSTSPHVVMDGSVMSLCTTRLTRGARPALADLQRAPLLVATKSDATVSRAKV